MIQALEQRQMFSATVALVSGDLQITGTPAADTVQIDQATNAAGNAILKVKVNGVTRTFPERVIKTITAKLGAGNDKLVANISGPMGPTDNGKTMLTVFAGCGNDFISGTNMNDRLLGEAGNDTLKGNEGFDRLN